MKKAAALLRQTADNIIKLIYALMGIAFVCSMFFSFYNGRVAVSNTLVCPEIPVIMYHNVIDSKDRVSKYVITPEMFEGDIVYLKERGYTTVLTRDIADFCEKGAPLPEKPVIITFDDGYYNNYSYAYPILKKHGEKAVISVVAEFSESASHDDDAQNNNYSQLTWEQAREMVQSGMIEIQNHSYSMHDLSKRKGLLRKKGEDFHHYKEMLIKDVMRAQDLIKSGTGADAIAFTYPFGAVNNESHDIIKELGFKVTYGCEEGRNVITSDPESLHRLKRYNRSGFESREAFFKKALGEN